MRAFPGASDTALGLARALALAALALAVPACRPAALPAPPVQKEPPRVLVVGLEHVALRTTAWVDLHAWLAAAARTSVELGDPALDPAVAAYAPVLADDDRDASLTRTTRALAACEDEPCARAAVSGTAFEKPYLDALPGYLARHWTTRATLARGGVEMALAALGDETAPLLERLAHDLAIDWPSSKVEVDLVADAPAPGRDAPIRALLSARGSCFAGERDEPAGLRDARILDCVLAYAALRLEERSTLASTLKDELRARGGADDFSRAWAALVVHASAATITGLQPKHVSVLRRSASAVMPEAMKWLASEWPARMRGEPEASFAKRYAVALREAP